MEVTQNGRGEENGVVVEANEETRAALGGVVDAVSARQPLDTQRQCCSGGSGGSGSAGSSVYAAARGRRGIGLHRPDSVV